MVGLGRRFLSAHPQRGWRRHPAAAAIECAGTSTCSNFYTGLKLESKTHFYGRAAAEEVLAGFLSALLRPRSGRGRGFAGKTNFFLAATGCSRDETPWSVDVFLIDCTGPTGARPLSRLRRPLLPVTG